MARTKVDFRKLYSVINEMPKKAALQNNRIIANLIREKILSLVAKGISPIEGNGRFPAYKGQSEKKRSKYPYSVKDKFPNKRARPVNLFLSGKFLKALKAFPKSINIISIGFFSSYGKKLERGHREGANGQAKRPIIPQEGERFAKSINLLILKSFREGLEEYLRKKL